jgi:hypothetical protein
METLLRSNLKEMLRSGLKEWLSKGRICGAGFTSVIPDICDATVQTLWLGCFPAGQYTIYYCGGVFNHERTYVVGGSYDPPSPAWVVTNYGTNFSCTAFTSILYSGSPNIQFVNTGNTDVVNAKSKFISCPPGYNGWDFISDAANDALGAHITFNHGGGPIGLQYFDSPASDNCSSDAGCGGATCGTEKKPKFSGPNENFNFWGLTAGGTCGTIFSGRYRMTFDFTSLCPYKNMVFNLVYFGSGSNNIGSPTTVTQDIVAGSNSVTFDFDLVDENNKCFGVKVEMIGGTTVTGATIPGTMVLFYDVTPTFSIGSAVGAFAGNVCPNYATTEYQQLTFETDYVSGLPLLKADGTTNDLGLHVTGSDIAQDLWFAGGSTCVATPALATSPTYCGNPGSSTLWVSTTSFHPSSISIVAHWTVGGCTLPPTSHTLSISW